MSGITFFHVVYYESNSLRIKRKRYYLVNP